MNVKFKDKQKYGNSYTLCIWCYTVGLDYVPPVPQLLGLGFPQGTKIQNPRHYDNAPKYSLEKDLEGHVIAFSKIFTQDFEICFLAPCDERLETQVVFELGEYIGGELYSAPLEGSGGTMLGPA